MKTIIVIPTYNEAGNIGKLLKAIFAENISDLEVLVVDDNSPDGTAEKVTQLTSVYPVHLEKRSGKLGLGSAYIHGFKKALSLGADYIFEMDADFSHDPDDIPRLLQVMEIADLAIGSRKILGGKVVGWGMLRKFMSNGAMWFSRFVLRLKTKDVTAGFRCFRRNVLESINIETIKSNGYAFQEELLYRTEQRGFRVIEVPVVFVDRQEGKSKLSRKDIVEFFVQVLRLKWEARTVDKTRFKC